MKIIIDPRKVDSDYVNVELVLEGDMIRSELLDKDELMSLAADLAYAAHQIAEAAIK